MTYGIPTDPATLLTLLTRRVATATNRPADAVFLSLYPDEWHLRFPPADRFATLRPPGGTVDQPGVRGGGRQTTGIDSTVRIACFTRLENEQEGRSTRTLAKASENVLSEWVRLTNALQLWTPVSPDAPTACLLKEAMRLLDHHILPKSDKDGSPWVVVESVYEMLYRLRLDETPPV